MINFKRSSVIAIMLKKEWTFYRLLAVVLSLLIAFSGLNTVAFVQQALASTGIAITNVTLQYTNPSINSIFTIEGNGFGQHSPYNGNSSYLRIRDVTTNWDAGWGSDLVHLNVIEWTESKIVVNGLTGAYGGGWTL